MTLFVSDVSGYGAGGKGGKKGRMTLRRTGQNHARPQDARLYNLRINPESARLVYVNHAPDTLLGKNSAQLFTFP